jgi:hypothetical protein
MRTVHYTVHQRTLGSWITGGAGFVACISEYNQRFVRARKLRSSPAMRRMRLDLVGTGPLQSKIKSLVSVAGLEGRVNFRDDQQKKQCAGRSPARTFGAAQCGRPRS